MRVTIRQIAEESGVSRGTVDRVLNNRGKVRPEVEERVRKVAEELGYKPNLLGRALIKMKENIKIGVILQDTGTPYLKTLSDGIKKAKGEVEDFGGTVIVKAVDYGNVEQTLAAMNKLKEAGIKGLVLMPINDKRVLQKIDQFTEEYGISVVTVNADVEDTKRICFVGQNSVQSGRAAAGLMHDILREEEGTIAVISGIETNTSLSDRIYGFCDEMKKISPKTEILDTKYCFEDDLIAAHLTESILNRYEDLSAIYITCHGEKGKANLGETHWATIVVFIAAYLVAGYDVLWRAICNIRRGEVFDENFLMTVASVGAMCVAEYAEGVAVMVLYQIGEYFQDKAVDKSRESITKLMDIRPDYANLVDGNDSRRVSPEQVRVGNIILVKPGEKIPLDGVVIEGNSSLNTTALTGESLPRDVKEGDQVLSGCVNLSGVMKVKVTVGYGESTVAKILALVESSGDAKAKTERFITKFSRIYTPAVCFFALALAIIPSLFDGNWTKWIYTALTFLVISCPCALVISVPLTFFSGIGGASKKGILIKGATYLETLAGLDTVVFDKTGTLTKGTFSVTGVHPAKGVTKDELLDAAAHAEAFSDHPIAISIKEALGRAVDMNRVSDASEAAGHGVQAKVDGQQVYAGNARLMESIGVKAAEPAEIGTVVHVARGGQYLGALVISDVIKENSASAMEALKSAGVKRLVMLTGDRKEVAADIAKKVGLTDYRAELLPEDKVSALEGLLGDGHTVAFTGDGINDAPVLRRADIGIAMGGVGADAAIEAADIVLMDDDPAKIAQGVRHARRTMRIVHQNIIFALAVKLLVMVLGICGFANMWLAVFADVGVAMLAILNAMRAMKMKQ